MTKTAARPRPKGLRAHLLALGREYLRHGYFLSQPRLDEPGFGEAVEANADELRALLTAREDDGFIEFDAYLKSSAMTARTVVAGLDGEPLEVEGRLFVLPVLGADYAVDRAFSDHDVLQRLTRTFRARGLAAPTSIVYVATALIPPCGVALADLTGIRVLTNAFFDSMVQGMRGVEGASAPLFEAIKTMFHGCLAGETPLDPEEPAILGRAVVGMRVNAVPAGTPMPRDYLTDFFSVEVFDRIDAMPVEVGEDGVDAYLAEHVGERFVDRTQVWLDAVNRSMGRDVQVELPQSFTDAAGTMARHSIGSYFAIRQARDDCSYQGADTLHLCHEPDVLWASFAFGNHVVGPLEVSMHLATWDAEGVLETLRERLRPGGRMVSHDSRATVPREVGFLLPANDH